MNQLINTLHWYESLVEWIKQDSRRAYKLELLKVIKTFEQIERLRTRSYNERDMIKREARLCSMIELYEQAVRGITKIRPIHRAYRKLSQLNKKLKLREAKLAARASRILEWLQKGLRPKNALGFVVQLKVGDSQDMFRVGPRLLSADARTMVYSRARIIEMRKKIHTDGFLAVAIEEVNWLARACGQVPDETQKSGWRPDLFKERKAIFDMLANVVDFSRKEPNILKRLVKTK